MAGERTTRDIDLSFTATAGEFGYADEYEMETATAIAGFDLLSGETGRGDFVLGVHGGVAAAKLERGGSSTRDRLDGATAGLYAAWWGESLSLDAALNANLLKLEQDRAVGEISDTNVISVGVRAEAGWRMPLGDSAYVQPLVTAAYVRSNIRDVVQGTFEASYEDVQSLRGAVGARVGGDVGTGMGRVGFWVTGRAWNEFAGDGALVLTMPGEDVAIVDDLGGGFGEVDGGLSLGNDDDTLHGFVSAGARLQDGADALKFSAGVRLRW